MNYSEWQQIADEAQLGSVEATIAVTGGDSHQSWRLITSHGSYFAKTALKRQKPLLVADAEGLKAIAATHTIDCPNPIAIGETSKTSWLILPWFELSQQGSAQQLGEQLANMHRHTQPHFGWLTTNFIGQSPQYNHTIDDWAAFYRSQRLLPQWRWAKERGLAHDLLDQLVQIMDRLDSFFIDYQPVASLLHGDLWSGNVAYQSSGKPIIFDPACYYGDRETDIAMTELFGGFALDFYAAYRATWPLDVGYDQRKPIYQLYHLLNHFNLFGGSYAASIRQTLAKIGNL